MENSSATTPAPATKSEEAEVKKLVDADIDILCAHANDATSSDELREDLGKWTQENLREMFTKEPDRQSFVCSRFYASKDWTCLELLKNYDCIYAIRNCGRQPVFAQFQFGHEKFPSFRVEPKTTQWLFDGMPILLLLAPHRTFYLTLFYENGHIIKHGYGIELFGAYWRDDIRRQLIADTSAKYFVSTRLNKTYMLQNSEFGECLRSHSLAPEDEPHTHRPTTKTFRGQPEAASDDAPSK